MRTDGSRKELASVERRVLDRKKFKNISLRKALKMFSMQKFANCTGSAGQTFGIHFGSFWISMIHSYNSFLDLIPGIHFGGCDKVD